jgi:preprotein translocase subunit YajC
MSSLFMSFAHAQAQAPAGQPPAFMQFIPIVFFFLIIYFFMLRPQINRQKKHQEFLTKLKHGDRIITSSGILGTVKAIKDTFVTLEVADGVRIEVLKTQVASQLSEGKS